MNEFFIVRLSPNPNKVQNPEERMQLGKGHHDFIDGLVDNNTIKFGGPIEGKPGGMLIVNGSSVTEVRALFQQDPLIKNQYLNCEVNKWTIKHGKLD